MKSRPCLPLVTFALGLVVTGAAAAPITFNGLVGGSVTPNGAVTYASPLVTDGFRFATTIGSVQFATWTPASDANTAFSNYTGSIALFSNSAAATSMTAADGSAFSVTSIDVANIYRNASFSQALTFVGVLSNGTTVTQVSTLPSDIALHTFPLAGFAGITSFTITSFGNGVANYIQFDNINVQATPSAVDEPSAALLLGIGTLAAFGCRRSRRVAGRFEFG